MICAGIRQDRSDSFFSALDFVEAGQLVSLPALRSQVRHGKVRDIVQSPRGLLLFASDRVSAFDKILALVPNKGEILTRIALFWFEQLADIIPNHIVEPVGSRACLVREARVLPVEVVVRGFLTGSAWRDYSAGRDISGHRLPEGMVQHQKLERPLITPSTKAEQGLHDEPISARQIVSEGIVEARLWAEIEDRATALFLRGQELARSQGLYLVDTKYEFGLIDGSLHLVDEVHTPDSSRYWYLDSYEEALRSGNDPQALDKEFLRRWLMQQGYQGQGQGQAPVIPAEVIDALSFRYQTAFAAITGQTFSPHGGSVQAEREIIASYL